MKNKNTPIVGIYFSDPKPMGVPFSKNSFVEAYTELIKYLSERGVTAVVVRGDTYRGNGIFNRYYRWSESKKVYVRVEKAISVDLIWNRDSENRLAKITDCAVYNDVELDKLCRDKLDSYNTFKDFSAETKMVNTFKEAKNYVKEHYSDKKVIIKPRYGEKSEGVYLIEDGKIEASLYEDWHNILIQEFLDSTAGIPGYVDGPHELKVWLIDGAFAGCRVKQLPDGEFISNAGGVSSGHNIVVDYNHLSPDLIEKIELLKQFLSKYPISLIRADFINNHGSYKLVEINSRPGLTTSVEDSSEFYWKISVQIADSILKFMNRKKKNQKLPLIIGAPHARTTVPSSVRKRIALSDYGIWRMGDPFTGFTGNHAYASANIKGNVNRILCDLSQGITPSLAFRKKDFYGNVVFVEGKEFTKKERNTFLEAHSKQYRSKILKAIQQLVNDGHKKIMFVDHHNTASEHPVNKSGKYMPAITVSNGGKRHSGKKMTEDPEILSCPPEFLHTFKSSFDNMMGFNTEINYIYKMSHTIRWLITEVAPKYPEVNIYAIFIEYDLNLIHNPITKRNDHLAKAKLRDAINASLDAVFDEHIGD